MCSCISNYVGTPPNCRPECVVSSECGQDRACINEKCKDPCPGTCGIHARCQVVVHNPICSCPSGYTGDPFVSCSPEESKNLSLVSVFFVNISLSFIYSFFRNLYIYTILRMIFSSFLLHYLYTVKIVHIHKTLYRTTSCVGTT